MPFPSLNFYKFFFLAMMCLLVAIPAEAFGKSPEEKPSSSLLPLLVVNNLQTRHQQGQVVFSFHISQKIHTPQTLTIPILITTGIGVFHFARTISSLDTDLSFALPDPPLTLVIDPDHVVKRRLTPAEIPPLWSGISEAKKITVVPETASLSIYAPLVHALGNKVNIVPADRIKNALLSKTTLLFLGADNTAARSLLAKPQSSQAGFSLDIHRNPLNPKYLAARALGSSEQEVKEALSRLKNDGDFSFIRFHRGKVIEKKIRKAEQGQVYSLAKLPAGAPTSAIRNFTDIIDRIATSRVVYVGETHNSVADHLLEFRIIQALYKRDVHLAIGMEMFPRSSQKALDEYVLGDTGMSEKDFLKKSNYFHVWRYDFRLFRNTFDFARRYKIPVIALNIDSKVVSSIFKSGSTDSLTGKEKKELPADRDLVLPGYANRLRKIYGFHTREMKDHGTASGFIQAQAIWDETMAKNIADYLLKHPGSHMVVLAGVQHVRKDSGIPPRVERYHPVRQATVVNISSQDQYANLGDIADYYFMEHASPLPPLGKIGIILEQIKTGNTSQLRIDAFSPHGKAEEEGLQKNDILLAINGNPVYDMADVRIAMLDVKPGQSVTVKIRRKDADGRNIEIAKTVTTSSLMFTGMHP